MRKLSVNLSVSKAGACLDSPICGLLQLEVLMLT